MHNFHVKNQKRKMFFSRENVLRLKGMVLFDLFKLMQTLEEN